MAHNILFANFDGFIIKSPVIIDLIEMFYRWQDSTFLIRTDESEPKFMGEHRTSFNGAHTITLVRRNIERQFDLKHRVGGNLAAPTIEAAAAMVFTHELQHANQMKMHAKNGKFYGKLGGMTPSGNPRMQRYWHRACERDARQFVDERMAEICAYFAVPFQSTRAGTQRTGGGAKGPADRSVLEVAELLRECPTVTMDDVRDELRERKALNPSTVKLVIEQLASKGMSVLPR